MTEKELIKQLKENFTKRNMLLLLEHLESEGVRKLKSISQVDNFRFTQGTLYTLEQIKKVVR